MSTQIGELSEVNKTLKAYLEQLLSTADSKGTKQLIKNESKRLNQALTLQKLERNHLIDHLGHLTSVSPEASLRLMRDSVSFKDFLDRVARWAEVPETVKMRVTELTQYPEAEKDYHKARVIAGLAAHRNAQSGRTQARKT
jgi:hypothetical protein